MTVEIRAFHPDDFPQWLELWKQYLVFYQHELADDITEETWRRLVAGEGPVFGILAVHGDEILGFAHYSFTHTTWEVLPDVYGEDLFVRPDARQEGVGRALIDALTDIATQAGASRLHWITQKSNATARRLYDSLGTQSDFVIYERATRPTATS